MIHCRCWGAGGRAAAVSRKNVFSKLSKRIYVLCARESLDRLRTSMEDNIRT